MPFATPHDVDIAYECVQSALRSAELPVNNVKVSHQKLFPTRVRPVRIPSWVVPPFERAIRHPALT